MEFEVKNQTKLKIKFVKVSKPLLQNHDLMSKTQEPKDSSLLASAEVCDYCDRIFLNGALKNHQKLEHPDAQFWICLADFASQH